MTGLGYAGPWDKFAGCGEGGMIHSVLHMKQIKRGLILLLMVLGSSLAQDLPTRPKIGLVLSGGGARGFGHIATLQLIDSLNLPIDYIAGTSMGGIMGALYSIGYDGVEIEQLVRKMNWEYFFSDEPPRQIIPYYKRRIDGRYQFEFEIKGGRPIPPDGLISGQKILLALSELTFAYENVGNFDDLPIPYRCVAVDLISGEEVILGSGSLSKAMRATMSIPTLFDPVVWGDSLLVDGGLLNNVPVDVVKAMGADIVITSNVGRSMRTRDELQSVVNILEQSLLISDHRREAINLPMSDIVIAPDVADLNAADFKPRNIRAIIARGRDGAESQRKALEQLVQTYDLAAPATEFAARKGYSRLYGLQVAGNTTLPFNFLYELSGLTPGDSINAELVEKKLRRMRTSGRIRDVNYSAYMVGANDVNIRLHVVENEYPTITGLVIKGNRRLSHSYVYQKLDIHEGDPFNPKLIAQRITQLYGLGVFKHIHYEIIPENSNQVKLVVIIEEQATDVLNLGFRYDDYSNLVGALGVIHDHLLIPGLRLEGEYQFAGLSRLRTRLLYPLGLDGFMIYPLLQFGLQDQAWSNYSLTGKHLAIYQDQRRHMAFGVGMHPRPDMVIEIDLTREETDLHPEVGQTSLPEWRDRLGYVNIHVALDELDNVLIPNTGRRLEINYQGSSVMLSSEKRFTRFEATADIYESNSPTTNVRFRSRVGVFPGGQSMLYKGFHLNGPDDFVGLDYFELSWNRIFLMRFDYRKELASDLYVKLIYNSAPNPRLARKKIYPLDVDIIHGFGVSLLYDSILGPVELTLARGERVAEDGNKYWRNRSYFTAGFKF